MYVLPRSLEEIFERKAPHGRYYRDKSCESLGPMTVSVSVAPFTVL